MLMRRRPLLRMAAVGGVSYMGAKAGTNRAIAAQQAPAPVPAPAAAPAAGVAGATDRIAQLQQLAQLHDSGALTDAEFAQEKARILA